MIGPSPSLIDRAGPIPGGFNAFPSEALEGSLVDRFRQQAAVHASRIAVSAPGMEWTYAELDARSNAIASAIVRRLGEASAPVALLMDQGAPLVAATLGILKARKFYVPLEPGHPLERCRETLAFAEARLVVTVGAHAAMARHLTGPGVDMVDIDRLQVGVDDRDPGVPVGPLDPAYLFFTSGSTGKPKGVMDAHRNVLHNIMRYTNALQVTMDDRLTLIQSASFSGTVSSLFTALLNGATVLPFDFRNEGFLRLAEWVQDRQATIYHSVPSIFRGMVQAGRRFPSVRVVRLEGDGATGVDVELFRSAFGGPCVLAHGLGATETGLSCQYRMTRDVQLPGDGVPIGFPLPDMYVSVVDEEGQEVPSGIVGEIEVRSAYLATGYWKDPALTRARFTSRAGDSDQRRYRTGDLGRMDANGCLFHEGRKDLEHKINGQWVSTGEVEHALKVLGYFSEVLAITRKDEGWDPRLVAYVVLRQGVKNDPAAWRRSLAGTLEGHLIPSAFVTLAALPLSAHGKVDRAALPAPGGSHAPVGVPRNDAEKNMIALWEDVLNVKPIGTRDDFFQLGGDSLRAALLVARVERSIGRVLPASALLTAPTVEEFQRLVDAAPTGPSPHDPLITLRAHGHQPPFFVVDWPGGYGWQFASMARLLGDDQPFHVLSSGGVPEPWPSGITIPQMAQAVIERIRSIQPTGPIRLGGSCYGGVIALEAAKQLKEKGDPVALLVMFAISPKDLPSMVPRVVHDAHTRAERRALWAKRRAELSAGPLKSADRLWRSFKRSSARLFEKVLRSMKGASGQLPPSVADDIYRERERALSTYRPAAHAGEVILFLADGSVRSYTSDAQGAWSELASRVTVHVMDGGENDLFDEPVVGEIAGLLKRALEDAAQERRAVRVT